MLKWIPPLSENRNFYEGTCEGLRFRIEQKPDGIHLATTVWINGKPIEKRGRLLATIEDAVLVANRGEDEFHRTGDINLTAKTTPDEPQQPKPPVPTTMDEAFRALDRLLSDEDRKFIQDSSEPEKVAIRLHHSLGRYLRNEWGLWSDSPLAQHIREKHGTVHPDDMSHLIITEYATHWIPTTWDRLKDDNGTTTPAPSR